MTPNKLRLTPSFAHETTGERPLNGTWITGRTGLLRLSRAVFGVCAEAGFSAHHPLRFPGNVIQGHLVCRACRK